MTIKGFYRTLATIMFLILVVITTSLFINKAINKGVLLATEQLDSKIAEYNTILGDNHIYDNIYFVNCFPKICARASHISYSEINIDEDGKRELLNKYELGTTDFVVAKINPLTGFISSAMDSNNLVLLQNGDVLGSAFIKGLNFEMSNGFINHIKKVLGKDVNLEKTQSISLNQPKFGFNETRIKAETLEYTKNVYNEKEKTISFADKLNLKGLVADADDIALNLSYDIAFENFDKKAYINIANLSITKQLEKILESADYNSLLSKNGMTYIFELFNAIEKADKNQTKLVINSFKLSEINTVNKEEKSYLISAKANLALDDNMNPKGFIKLDVKNPNSAMLAILQGAKVYDEQTKESKNLFALNEKENTYSLNAEFKGETVIVNEAEINIDGKFKQTLDGVSFMISMMAMQIK